MAHGGALAGARRGRGTMKGQSRKYIPLSQNGIGKKALGDIEILHTDALIKEVEKVFGTSHPEVRQQRKCLKNTNKH